MPGFISSTAFLDAAGRGDLRTVRDYLSAGGNVHFTDTFGENAFYRAILMEQDRVVRILLDAGFNATTPISVGDEVRTPLHEAAISGMPKLIKRLVKAGADANAAVSSEDPEVHGRTPLMAACYHCGTGDMLGTIVTLFEYGANPNLVDAYGRNALMHLLENFPQDTSGQIDEQSNLFGLSLRPVKRDPQELSEERNTFLRTARLLIAAGTKLDQHDNCGNTAADYAREYGVTDVLSLLEGFKTRT